MPFSAREKHRIRIAVMWHQTTTDLPQEATVEADLDEVRRIEADPVKVRRILRAWLQFDKTKPEVLQRTNDRQEVEQLLSIHFS